jgi:hypothetical protein
MRKIKYPFYNQDLTIDINKLEAFKNEYLLLFSKKFKDDIDKFSIKIDSNLNHQKILCSTFPELINLALKFNNNCHNWNSLNDLFKTETDFKYKNKRSDILNFIVNQNINIKSCHYCNIDFINFFKEEDNVSDHSTFDHVLPKVKFPFLSLSFFNLVPCCYSCNSKFKGTDEFIISDSLKKIIPSSEEYQLNDLMDFQLKFTDKAEIIKQDDIKIHLTNLTKFESVDEFIRIFKLKGRYEFHKDISFDIIKKRKIYSDSQIKEIANLLNRDVQSIKEDIFGKECFESNNEPFEKYKQDIAKQLGLI